MYVKLGRSGNGWGKELGRLGNGRRKSNHQLKVIRTEFFMVEIVPTPVIAFFAYLGPPNTRVGQKLQNLLKELLQK